MRDLSNLDHFDGRVFVRLFNAVLMCVLTCSVFFGFSAVGWRDAALLRHRALCVGGVRCCCVKIVRLQVRVGKFSIACGPPIFQFFAIFGILNKSSPCLERVERQQNKEWTIWKQKTAEIAFCWQKFPAAALESRQNFCWWLRVSSLSTVERVRVRESASLCESASASHTAQSYCVANLWIWNHFERVWRELTKSPAARGRQGLSAAAAEVSWTIFNSLLSDFRVEFLLGPLSNSCAVHFTQRCSRPCCNLPLAL